jgi:hypothetical protein
MPVSARMRMISLSRSLSAASSMLLDLLTAQSVEHPPRELPALGRPS